MSNFRIGEEVRMDRKSPFFIKAVSDLDKETLLWWGELESMQPLVIKSVGEQVEFEDIDYRAMSDWLKPLNNKQ